jgi:hypothetical protein
MTKSLEKKKGLRAKLKKRKILHNSSTIMCDRMNIRALHSEIHMTFGVILNYMTVELVQKIITTN